MTIEMAEVMGFLVYVYDPLTDLKEAEELIEKYSKDDRYIVATVSEIKGVGRITVVPKTFTEQDLPKEFTDALRPTDTCLIENHYKRHPEDRGKPMLLYCGCSRCSVTC